MYKIGNIEIDDNMCDFKLLYVEDNLSIQKNMLPLLKNFFCNIIVASDGEDGFKKFQDNDIDVIITDINMPKMNGLEMIEMIRQIDKNIPILIISSYYESSILIKSIELGVDGYILKPAVLEQFEDMLNKTIEKLFLKQELEKNLLFLEEYKNITDEATITSKTDKNGKITYVNDKFCKLSGYSKDELIGKSHNIIRHPDMPKEVFKNMWDTIKNKKRVWKGIIKNRDKNGKSYFVDTVIKPILDKNGNILEFIALRSDVTEVMNPKKQFDILTNNGENLIVVYIQLEDFDIIEELLDDIVINKIQEKIVSHLENSVSLNCKFEKIYSLGDGKYAMAQEKDIVIDTTVEKFEKQLKQFQYNVENNKINLFDIDYKPSVMISYAYDEYPLESAKLGIKELLKIKQNFINANGLYNLKKEEALNRLNTLKTIKYALENHKIVSYFQPIVDNVTKNIVKYESLVRIIDKDGKILTPYYFLDVAKKGKYYIDITSMVLNNSFYALKTTNMDISINLSALDIEDKNMRDRLYNILEDYKKDAHRVVFELLEDENIKNMNIIKNFIKKIKEYGVSIAIDDFGAGYSNFERLLYYQPDILKIDGSLIKNILTDRYSLDVVKTILEFAKRQKIKTVAEYVENENLYKLLCDLGVDFSQGYYFGKPEPLENL